MKIQIIGSPEEGYALTFKTPSGKRHPLSEWIAVDFYAATKYGMMGETPSDLAAILLLRDLQAPGTSTLKQSPWRTCT